MASDWQKKLDNKLFSVLQNRGIEEFLQLGVLMLNIDPRGDKKLRGQVSGEVCEVMLVGITQRYAEVTKVPMRVFHSVVLKDLTNLHGDFRTELDAVIVTPYFILTSECKSYYGEVVVSDKCTLSHCGSSTDVWRQSRLHHRSLVQYSQQFVKTPVGNIPVFANAFVFSNAVLRDERVGADKLALRVLTTRNVVPYYDAMFKRYKTPVFDYNRACKIFQACADSNKLHAEHKKFLGY